MAVFDFSFFRAFLSLNSFSLSNRLCSSARYVWKELS